MIRHPHFDTIIMCIIVLNTVLMAADGYGISDKTAATLSQLFADTQRTERKRARGPYIQKAEANPKGPAQQARTKATAWASKTAFAFPQGRTTLEELGLRSEPGRLHSNPRRRRSTQGHREAMDRRRDIRRGAAPAVQEAETAAVPPGEDVQMEAEQQPADQAPRADAVGGAGRDPREWTGAQVVANTDRLLLGSLDEEFADNPDPDEEDWDRPDDNDHGPDEEDRPTEQELAEAAPRERQPSSRSQQATRKLLEQWRGDAAAPCRDAPPPPRLELWCDRPQPDFPGLRIPRRKRAELVLAAAKAAPLCM